MSFGPKVSFSKKLVLFWLVPLLLAGWAVAPMNADASVQQTIKKADDGTVYQHLCYDGSIATGHLRLTNASLALNFNAAATVTGTASSGVFLDARVPASRRRSSRLAAR